MIHYVLYKWIFKNNIPYFEFSGELYKSMISYNESNSYDIPKKQGIYSFYLDIINPTLIGLIGINDFNEAQLLNAKRLLIKRIQKMYKIISNSTLLGSVDETGKSRYLKRKYSIQMEEVYEERILENIEKIPCRSIYDFSNILYLTNSFSQPIYVGISRKQTLYERFKQHRSDYYNSEDVSKFGVRLKNIGLEWDDISFKCVPIQKSSNDDDLLINVEKHFHYISKPILSRG